MNYRDDFDAAIARLDAAERELKAARAKDVVDEARVAELEAALTRTRQELASAKERLAALEPPAFRRARARFEARSSTTSAPSDAEPTTNDHRADPPSESPSITMRGTRSPASDTWAAFGICIFLALVLLVVLVVVRAKRETPPVPLAITQNESSSTQAAPAAPEPRPHPHYPTALAAGTDKIFRAQEPDRGPKVPTTFAVPSRTSLVWTTYAYCDVGVLDVSCTPGAGFTKWRVGRRGVETIVAEEMRGSRVDRIFVFQAKTDGTPLQRVEINSFGRVVEMLTFTSADRYVARKPTGANGLPGCGSIGVTIDKKRRVVERRRLQWNGEPMADTTGVAVTELGRDPRGIVIEKRFLGVDRKPVTNKYGTAAIYYDLDKDGRDAVERYRDVDGKPIAAIDGCFAWRYKYDARGLMVSETCLDETDQPKASGSGFAIATHRYNGHGCLIATRYSETDGAPASDRDGVHGVDIDPDVRCLALSNTCVNLVNQPVACGVAPSSARVVNAYDQRGRLVSRKHYNADGSHGGDSAYQVFERRWEYDEVGNAIRSSCYDTDGQPAECAGTGFHAVVRAFDYAGRAVEDRYLDTHDHPTMNLDTMVERVTYDNYDHWSESTDYDAEGKIVESLGMATRRELYDENHRRFAVLLFDRNGKRARYRACFPGVSCPQRPWHAVRLVRDAHGYVATNMFFDADRQLIETHDCAKAQCFE